MKKKTGFTLIELMVSVTIILILVGIGSYSINNFTQSKKISGVRDELLTQIKLARNLAITNQLPDKTADLKYVRVTVLDKTITVEAIKNDGSIKTETPYFSKKLESSENVSISVLNGSNTITSFGFLGKSGRLVDTNGIFVAGPFTISISDTISNSSFNINDLGIINDND